MLANGSLVDRFDHHRVHALRAKGRCDQIPYLHLVHQVLGHRIIKNARQGRDVDSEADESAH